MEEHSGCPRLQEFLEEAKQYPGVSVEEPGDPELDPPSFHRWPRQLDMWPLEALLAARGWKPKPPIIRVDTADAVAHVLRAAGRHRVCIVPRGGGSNVVGAAFPSRCCVLLDLSGLNRILGFSREDLYVYAEAGINLARLEEWLNKRGYTLSYQPQSLLLASLGGSIAMLGSGAYAPGRGNIEDIVLWIDVALVDGSIVTLGSPRSPRGWEGPGVKHLFIGSEGGLGVVVAAGLRVRPLPDHVVDLAFTMPGLREALEAARRLVLWGRPSILRVLDTSEAMILHSVDKPVLLVRLEGDDKTLLEAEEAYVRRLVGGLGGVERSELFQHWLRARYNYDKYVEQLWSSNLWFDTIDTAAYWSTLERLNKRLLDELQSIRGVVAVFSHAGHFYVNGGSLYHTVVMERDPVVYWRVWEKAARIVLEEGASLTHQHGVGMLRLRWVREALGDNYRIYCRVKQVLDPAGTLATSLASRCKCS